MTMTKKVRALKNRRKAMKKAQKAARVLLNKQTSWMGYKGYVPVAEAAELVGLSVPRIYQLLNKHDLEGTREGTRRYVRLASLKRRFPHALARMVTARKGAGRRAPVRKVRRVGAGGGAAPRRAA